MDTYYVVNSNNFSIQQMPQQDKASARRGIFLLFREIAAIFMKRAGRAENLNEFFFSQRADVSAGFREWYFLAFIYQSLYNDKPLTAKFFLF